MSTLGNFVTFTINVPRRIRILNPRMETITIRDPTTDQPKQVQSKVYDVVEEDGVIVAKKLSVIAEKLAAQLTPYDRDPRLRDILFSITKRGTGFLTEYTVMVERRP